MLTSRVRYIFHRVTNMKVMIFNSIHAANVFSRIQGIENITGEKVELRVSEIMQYLIQQADEEEDPVRAEIFREYGEEIIALKNDLMNKLARLEEMDWFKEIYLYSECGMVVMTF